MGSGATRAIFNKMLTGTHSSPQLDVMPMPKYLKCCRLILVSAGHIVLDVHNGGSYGMPTGPRGLVPKKTQKMLPSQKPRCGIDFAFNGRASAFTAHARCRKLLHGMMRKLLSGNYRRPAFTETVLHSNGVAPLIVWQWRVR